MESSDSTEIHVAGRWEEVLERVGSRYSSVLLLTSEGARNRGTLDLALQAIGCANVKTLSPAPITPSVSELVQKYGGLDFSGFQAVVALGGGSVIDSAKAVVLASQSQSREDFEMSLRAGAVLVGKGPLDIIAIPTTAGAGSEVTPFATIWDTENFKKKSISGACLRPRHAILDPTLLSSLHGQSLLFPALDATSHAVESLWSRGKSNQSQLEAVTGLALLMRALPSCTTATPDFAALSLGSLHSGLAISESRTAIAHSISYPLTLHYGVPHGLACSFTLGSIHRLLEKRLGTYCPEINWITSVTTLLEHFNLPMLIGEYVTLAQALELSNAMFTPGRGDNFIMQVDSDVIEIILYDAYMGS